MRKIDAHLRSSCDNVDPHGNAFGHVVFDRGESHDFASYERFLIAPASLRKPGDTYTDARALCLACRCKLRCCPKRDHFSSNRHPVDHTDIPQDFLNLPDGIDRIRVSGLLHQ